MNLIFKTKEFIKKFTPFFLLTWYHWLLALAGAVIFGFPSRKIKVIGVTGTKGKTTVVELTAAILNEAGYQTAAASSIRFSIGSKYWENRLKMTMPGRFKLQQFLRKAVRHGAVFAVLEITSEGILQHRHRFIKFDTVVFTNLSPEHLERHGGFENYRQAKGRLFQRCLKRHIVNLDDENAGYFLKFPSAEKLGYGVACSRLPENGAEKVLKIVKAENVKISEESIEFRVNETVFALGLQGSFNVENALAAITVALSYGVGLEVSQKALAQIKNMPGRMETIVKKPFRVIVDYAHTPDSLAKVYQSIKTFFPSAETVFPNQQPHLICVFGSCGGGRDKWKRPALGRVAAAYCDKIILTNEDPYDENPQKIIEEIAAGILEEKGVTFWANHCLAILERREAIKKALGVAKPGDTVIITGKGSEVWMCLAGGKKIPWSDKKIVLEEYQQLC